MNLEILNRTGLISVSDERTCGYLEKLGRTFVYQQYSCPKIVKGEYSDKTDEFIVYLNEDVDLNEFADSICNVTHLKFRINEENHSVVFLNVIQNFYHQDAMLEFNSRLTEKVPGANIFTANLDFSSVRLIIFNKSSVAKSKRYMRKIGYKQVEIDYDGSVWILEFKL